jgi:hypothetical protein
VANPTTPGEEFFENYCMLNGYLAEHDVNWRERFGVDTEKNPDYLIDRVGDRAIVEVKHFETTRVTERLLAESGRAVWWTQAESFGTIQSAVRYAAEEQLAQFAGLGIPLVVALTNPLQADVSFDPEDVVSALFGRVEWHFDWNREARPPQAVFTGDGAVLTTDANGAWVSRVPHLSAVATLYGFPDFARVDVYDLSGAPGFTGTRLPSSMFDGDECRWFGFTAESRFARLPGPPGASGADGIL